MAFPAGQPLWSGPMPGLAVSVALLLPLAGALIARGSERDTGFGFARGLLGSLLGGAVAGLLASLTAWPSESVSDALYAVLFLAVVAPLPGLVADWALALPRCRLRPPPPRWRGRYYPGARCLPRIAPSRLRAARPWR